MKQIFIVLLFISSLKGMEHNRESKISSCRESIPPKPKTSFTTAKKEKPLITPERKRNLLESAKKKYITSAKREINYAELYRTNKDLHNQSFAYLTALNYLEKSLQCSIELKVPVDYASIGLLKDAQERFHVIFCDNFNELTYDNVADLDCVAGWHKTIQKFINSIKSNDEFNELRKANNSLQAIATSYVAVNCVNTVNDIDKLNIPTELRDKIFCKCELYKINFDEYIYNILILHAKQSKAIGELLPKQESDDACFFFDKALKYSLAAITRLINRANIIQKERDYYRRANFDLEGYDGYRYTYDSDLDKLLDRSLQKQRNFYLRKADWLLFEQSLSLINTLGSKKKLDLDDPKKYKCLCNLFIKAYPESKRAFEYDGIHTY